MLFLLTACGGSGGLAQGLNLSVTVLDNGYQRVRFVSEDGQHGYITIPSIIQHVYADIDLASTTISPFHWEFWEGFSESRNIVRISLHGDGTPIRLLIETITPEQIERIDFSSERVADFTFADGRMGYRRTHSHRTYDILLLSYEYNWGLTFGIDIGDVDRPEFYRENQSLIYTMIESMSFTFDVPTAFATVATPTSYQRVRFENEEGWFGYITIPASIPHQDLVDIVEAASYWWSFDEGMMMLMFDRENEVGIQLRADFSTLEGFHSVYSEVSDRFTFADGREGPIMYLSRGFAAFTHAPLEHNWALTVSSGYHDSPEGHRFYEENRDLIYAIAESLSFSYDIPDALATAHTPPPEPIATADEPVDEPDAPEFQPDAAIVTDDWVTIYDTISIPLTWDYLIWGGLEVFGDAPDGSPMDIFIFDIQDEGEVDTYLSNAMRSEPFMFNDGNLGHMVEFETSVIWINTGASGYVWIARWQFEGNELLVTEIARSLQ